MIDRIFNVFTFMVAIAISCISAFYSISGLATIFSAAFLPIVIMGSTLEVGKITSVIWLHKYWNRASWKIKAYLMPAVIILMLITSMGTYGYLAKAHSDQSLVSGDVGAKVAIYDEKIKTAKENIDANRKALQQMDAAVDQTLGRSTDEKGAANAVSIRRSQSRERARLNTEIQAEQEAIAKLNEESAPIRAQVRKVEAEVGPIKYIAALIYGDNPDANLLERAVRWVIILIVFVFDPLALTLVLAAQSSYRWLDEDLEEHRKNEEGEKFKETFLNNKLDADTAKHLDEVFTDNASSKKKTNECCVTEGAMYCNHDGDCAVTEVMFPKESVQSEPVSSSPAVSESEETTQEESAEVSESVIAETPSVKTDDVTIHETGGGYVQYQGKSVSKVALREMHPEIFAIRPDAEQINTNFGTAFPTFAKKGDVFVRVDMLPNRVYKFDGKRWIEVNKEQSDSYLYDEAYVRHLISKIESGEYDPELLSENEKIQIEEYLQKENDQ